MKTRGQCNMVIKSFSIIVIAISLLAITSHSIFAKRVLPQVAQQTKTETKTQVKSGRGVTVSVKFRADRNAIIATFTNLRIAKDITYNLSYKNADGIEQVAQSSVDPKAKEPVVRELLFGTCSTNNICHYDTGIKDAKFIVTTTLLNGKKVVKTFNLKVKK